MYIGLALAVKVLRVTIGGERLSFRGIFMPHSPLLATTFLLQSGQRDGHKVSQSAPVLDIRSSMTLMIL